jgi:hypothetical protein
LIERTVLAKASAASRSQISVVASMSTGGLSPEEKLIVIVADLPLHAPHMRKVKKRHGVAPGRLPISPSMTKTLA